MINTESRQKKGMFILSGFVVNRGKEYLVRILIDLGSSHQYILSNFISKSSLEVEENRDSSY